MLPSFCVPGWVRINQFRPFHLKVGGIAPVEVDTVVGLGNVVIAVKHRSQFRQLQDRPHAEAGVSIRRAAAYHKTASFLLIFGGRHGAGLGGGQGHRVNKGSHPRTKGLLQNGAAALEPAQLTC